MVTTFALPLQRPAFGDLEGLFTRWDAAPFPEPRLVVLNDELAAELGLDPTRCGRPKASPRSSGSSCPTAP